MEPTPKFILVAILIGCLVCGIIAENGKRNKTDEERNGFGVVEFTVRGETHEYIRPFGTRAVVHLPNCRTCRKDAERGND